MRKHTKKGDKDVDIKPDFQNVQLQPQEDGLLLQLRLPCSMSGSTNPALAVGGSQAVRGRRALLRHHAQTAAAERFFRMR